MPSGFRDGKFAFAFTFTLAIYTYNYPVLGCPGAHPASYTMGTGSLPEVKWPGRGVDHLPPYSAEVKERVELYLYSTSGTSWSVIGRTLPFPLLRIRLFSFLLTSSSFSLIAFVISTDWS